MDKYLFKVYNEELKQRPEMFFSVFIAEFEQIFGHKEDASFFGILIKLTKHLMRFHWLLFSFPVFIYNLYIQIYTYTNI